MTNQVAVMVGSECLDTFSTVPEAQAYIDSGTWANTVPNARQASLWIARWENSSERGWIEI